MKLSYSAISSYQTCPLQYKFQYIEKRPTLPSPALSFGQSLHEALRWFYDVPTPDPYQLNELLDHLEICWVSKGYGSPEEETRYFYHAKSILELFYRNLQTFNMPVALEHRFLIDIGPCSLSGVIDRVDKDPVGGFEIIDYKTNRRLPPAKKLHEDLQLPIYQMAAEKIWEVSPDKVSFYYLLMNHKHSFQITPDRLNRSIQQIEEVVSGIETGTFDPRKNPLCPWCDFIESCPVWEGKPRKVKASRQPSMEIGQIVDELLATDKKISQAVLRIEGLKSALATYLEEHKISRVTGSKGTAFIDDDGSLSWRGDKS